MIDTAHAHIAVEASDGIAVITLANPEKRNALSLETMRELTAALERVGRDASIRVVVLAATGPVFSSGHNLKEMLGRDLETYREIFDVCVLLMERIQSIPQPVIAQVAGIATAAGCQLVATCDLAIAAADAKFATPGVKIGLFCTTPMVALTRAIGRKRAMEMLLTGEFIDARTAADWGLINRAVDPAELERTVRELAETIRDASGPVVALGKSAFYAQIDRDQTQAYDFAKEVMSRNALEADAQEGMSAFLERRPPVWKR
jgi:enoyl-CoA hydratase/carnithine racemase